MVTTDGNYFVNNRYRISIDVDDAGVPYVLYVGGGTVYLSENSTGTWNQHVIYSGDVWGPVLHIAQDTLHIAVSDTTTNQLLYIHGSTVQPSVILATIDINPDILNLNSTGKWVTAYIELPSGYSINDIDCNAIEVNLDSQAVEPESCDRPIESLVDDHDGDGILEYMVKFDRSAVGALLGPSDEVELTVTGELIDGIPFKGTDTIRVIEKGNKNKSPG